MTKLMMRSPAVRWSLGGVLLLGCATMALVRGRGADPGAGRGLFSSGDPSRVSGRSPTAARLLKVEQAFVDFGVIPLGETRSLSVLVQNPSRRSVRIQKVTSECVCVKGEMEFPSIEPGGKAELTVNFRAIPGKTSYRSSVSIITDEDGPSRYDIAVTAKIKQEFVLEPETLDFGRIPKGGVSRKEVRITRDDGTDFSIAAITPSRPDVTYTWKAIDSSPKPGFLIIAEARGIHAGVRVEAFRIETGPAPESGPMMQVALEVESSFFCTPALVSTVYAPDGKLGAFETVVRGRDGQDVKVESVQDAKGTSLEFDAKTSSSSECVLTIKLTGDLAPDQHLGSLQIKLKGEDQPLSLPYRVDHEGAPEKR